MCELEIKKIGKMIKKVLNEKLEMNEICFKQLCQVYENLTNAKKVVKNDIKPIEIFSLNKPKKVKIIAKFQTIVKINMCNVISELQTNELFLKRKDLCINL